MKVFFLTLIFGLTLIVQPLFSYDAEVVIKEATINKFLQAVGEISGSGTQKVLLFDVGYTWKICNPRIILTKNGSEFVADSSIQAGSFTNDSPVKGRVEFFYDKDKNIFNVKISKIDFNLHFDFLGNRIQIMTLDLAQFYKPEFQFQGPEPIQSSVEVEVPSGKKTVYITTLERSMSLEDGKIILQSTFGFSDKKPVTDDYIPPLSKRRQG